MVILAVKGVDRYHDERGDDVVIPHMARTLQKNNLGNNIDIHNNNNNVTKFEREQFIPAMAKRNFHLPGNNALQDYIQYLRNYHPIFSLCCHHRLHPISPKIRIMNAACSLMFGFCATNIMWLWFYNNNSIDGDNNNNNNNIDGNEQNQAPIELSYHWKRSGICDLISNKTNTSFTLLDCNETDSAIGNDTYVNAALTEFFENTTSKANDIVDETFEQELDLINYGTIMLWTFGALLHALYDYFIWYLEVGYCFLPKKITSLASQNKYTQFKWCGMYVVTFFILTCTSLATVIAMIHAASDRTNEKEGDHDPSINEDLIFNTTQNDEVSSYSENPNHRIPNPFQKYNISIFQEQASDMFIHLQHTDSLVFEYVVSYVGELTFALLVYYPIVTTILFSGIIGCCGLIPICGGRPYEVKIEEKERKKKMLEFARSKYGVVA